MESSFALTRASVMCKGDSGSVITSVGRKSPPCASSGTSRFFDHARVRGRRLVHYELPSRRKAQRAASNCPAAHNSGKRRAAAIAQLIMMGVLSMLLIKTNCICGARSFLQQSTEKRSASCSCACHHCCALVGRLAGLVHQTSACFTCQKLFVYRAPP